MYGQKETLCRANRCYTSDAGGSSGSQVEGNAEKARAQKAEDQSKASEARSKAKSAAAEKLHAILSTRPLRSENPQTNPVIKAKRV